MPARRVLLIAIALTVPSVSYAQRSKAASGRDRNLMAEDAGRGRNQISVRDLENQSPIKLLVDKRRDLKLTDAQLGQVKDIESKLKDKNAPLFKIVDSLNRVMRPAASDSDDERSEVRAARQELMGTIKDIRDNYDLAAKDAVVLLDEAQQKTANDLLAKQRDDIEKSMRPRGGGEGMDRRPR